MTFYDWLLTAVMSYPGMSADVFQNANISILTCQLFVMLISLAVAVYALNKGKAKPITSGAKT